MKAWMLDTAISAKRCRPAVVARVRRNRAILHVRQRTIASWWLLTEDIQAGARDPSAIESLCKRAVR